MVLVGNGGSSDARLARRAGEGGLVSLAVAAWFQTAHASGARAVVAGPRVGTLSGCADQGAHGQRNVSRHLRTENDQTTGKGELAAIALCNL